jgi:hypothetical protein
MSPFAGRLRGTNRFSLRDPHRTPSGTPSLRFRSKCLQGAEKALLDIEADANPVASEADIRLDGIQCRQFLSENVNVGGNPLVSVSKRITSGFLLRRMCAPVTSAPLTVTSDR